MWNRLFCDGERRGWDFFVSCTQADRAWAQWIAWIPEEDASGPAPGGYLTDPAHPTRTLFAHPYDIDGIYRGPLAGGRVVLGIMSSP